MALHVQHETPETHELVDLARHVRRLTLLAFTGFAVAVGVILAYAYKFGSALSGEHARWGEFGDYVGGLLNPTFAFLALIALLGTLGLQVRELRMSVRELANSAAALAKQNETLRLQTFEGTFFQTLRLHNDIVNSLRLPHRTLSGRECFRAFASELQNRLASHGAERDLGAAIAHYEVFFRENQAVLGHYFRLLYNMVKLVHNSEGVDKRFYTNLIRAQLSSSELYLLFYNCLSSLGSEKFKPLVEQYALLKNIPDDDTLPDEVHLRVYSASAFGGAYPESWL